MPEIKLFTRSGGVTVRFKKLDISVTTLSPDELEMIVDFNQFLNLNFYKDYLSKDCTHHLDLENGDDRIAKALVVPLTKKIMVNVDRAVYQSGSPPVDYEFMQNVRQMRFSELPELSTDQQLVVRKTYLNEDQNKRLYYVTGDSGKTAGDFMEGRTTFAQYYEKKYGRQIDTRARLLTVVPVSSSSISYKEDQGIKTSQKENGRHLEELVPELCRVASVFPAQYHMKATLLPFALYRLECELNAIEFKEELLSGINDMGWDEQMSVDDDGKQFTIHNFGDPVACEMRKMRELLSPSRTSVPASADILEALTTRQALFEVDLERLEMLGDAFLKQAVSIFLFFKHPTYDEGRLTRIRKKEISNKNLWNIAVWRSVCHYVNNSHFGDRNRHKKRKKNENEDEIGVRDTENENKNPATVWLPPSFKRVVAGQPQEQEDVEMDGGDDDDDGNGDDDAWLKPYSYQTVQDKSLSDCIEALIGMYV